MNIHTSKDDRKRVRKRHARARGRARTHPREPFLDMSMRELEKSLRILAPLLSDAKKQRIADVVANRTGSLAVLLENVWDKGNRNAVMRSMDAFGVHTLHKLSYGKERVEPLRRKYGASEMRTDAGARKWLVTKSWTDVEDCLRQLKLEGYKLASTVPDASMKLADVDFTQRLVISFGNEHTGVSETVLKASDVQFAVPMIGFVQSLNLSVCVAVTLQQAFMQRLAELVNISIS